MPRKPPFPFVVAAALVVSLGASSAGDPGVWPTQGWDTATPSEMGLDASKLIEARDYALTGAGSGLITRGGKVVLSWGPLDARWYVKSTTKSIGVTILGLALQDGLVDVSDAAQQHYPEVGTPPESNAATGWLDDITLEQLATHSAGFAKPGGFIDLLYQPGTTWAYSDGGANWLADVMTVVYGQDLYTVFSDRVLTPLGLTSVDFVWESNGYRPPLDGIARREFGSGVAVNVDAMARIGYLYLRNGSWDGTRIIPDGFVADASRPVASIVGLPVAGEATYPAASNHYGLLWWNNGDGTLPGVPTDAFWSWGLRESLIVVIPSLDIVAARAGSSGWQPDWSTDYAVVEPFLTPIAEAVLSNDPPTAEAGGPYAAVEGANVVLDGSGSTDPDGAIASFAWDLDGDGNFDDATGQSPSIAAGPSGTRDVWLEVTDALGARDTDAAVISVDNVAPTARAGGPYAVGVAGTVLLDGSASSDPGQDITSWDWDLDADGAYDDATGVQTAFSSSETGDHAVGLRVTDDDGAISLDWTTVTVSEQAPQVLDSILVTPDPVDVFLCDTQGFVAAGFDTGGAPMEIDPIWSTDGGSVDDDGVFTPGTTLGGFTVAASDGAITGEASVNVVGSFPRNVYLEFDGQDDFVEVAYDPSLDLTAGELTVSAWIYLHGWGQNSQGRIADHGGGTVGSAGWTLMLEGASRTLRFLINNDFSYDSLADEDAVTLGAWQHVAATLSAGELRFYVNGAARGVRTGAPAPAGRTVPLRFGRRATDAFRSFYGTIDEVRVWNRALSRSEIEDGMHTELAGSEPGLVAYWRMNSADGQIVLDSAENDYHGILGATAQPDASDPTRVDSGGGQLDADNDGSVAACDCHDDDQSTYPRAVEANDAIDNQCPGDYGYGSIDETGPDAGFYGPDVALYSWSPQAGATTYEVARSTSPRFEPGSCITVSTNGTSWYDDEVPSPGIAFFYLNRASAPNPGGWGPAAAGTPRPPLCD